MRSLRPAFSARRLASSVSVVLLVLALACAGCGSAGRARSASPAATGSSTPGGSRTAGAGATAATQTSTTTTPSLPGTGRPAVTIGDKNYTEQFVLGQLYSQALKADGFTVNLNQNIGPTDVTVQALNAGTLTLYPEYLDIFNSAIAGDRQAFPSQFDAYTGARRYALAHGLQLLAPTPFSDTAAIGVTLAYAGANQLGSIRDLRHVAGSLTIGGPPQFQQGPPGLPEIKQAYGIAPAAFKTLAVGDQYSELDAGSVQAAVVQSTDGQLATGDYVLLGDPRRIFGWGNVVPVVSAKMLASEGPAFASTINRVDAALTTSVMRQLNQLVDVAQQDPAVVAKQFLETHGLVTPSPS